MPTFTALRSDLEALLGEEIALAELERRLELVKGELGNKTKSGEEIQDRESGQWTERRDDFELRIELNDTNRPDQWGAAGVARQLRVHAGGEARSYDFYTTEPAERRITVDERLGAFRPFVGGFLASGGRVDEGGLLAFIELQEVLTRNFGRKRKSVSIGIYDAASIAFPVRYHAVKRDESAFVPLTPVLEEGQSWESRPMTPAEILELHPTGREYASILEGLELVPMLTDSGGKVLSFPPIINSNDIGRVEEGMDQVFVEVTGTDLDHCLLALNIMAADLADRGWAIEPVTTEYPYDTEKGREVTAPHAMPTSQTVPRGEFGRLLGEDVSGAAIVERLAAFGVAARHDQDSDVITATTPSYRRDYLHPVDVIEDFAISRGYDSFEPLMPEEFTVGGVAPEAAFEDLIRDRMIGFGFEEAICNILTAAEIQRADMGLSEAGPGFPPFHGGPLVRIRNVMNLNYSVLRDWMLPSLLEIERSSSGASYPHRVFETGEVAVFDPSQNLGSRTELRLGALIVEEGASFDAAQSVVYALLTGLGIDFTVTACAHPSFIEGRAARVQAGDVPLGFLGEVAPRVLDQWKIHTPAAALELELGALQTRARA